MDGVEVTEGTASGIDECVGRAVLRVELLPDAVADTLALREARGEPLALALRETERDAAAERVPEGAPVKVALLVIVGLMDVALLDESRTLPTPVGESAPEVHGVPVGALDDVTNTEPVPAPVGAAVAVPHALAPRAPLWLGNTVAVGMRALPLGDPEEEGERDARGEPLGDAVSVGERVTTGGRLPEGQPLPLRLPPPLRLADGVAVPLTEARAVGEGGKVGREEPLGRALTVGLTAQDGVGVSDTAAVAEPEPLAEEGAVEVGVGPALLLDDDLVLADALSVSAELAVGVGEGVFTPSMEDVAPLVGVAHAVALVLPQREVEGEGVPLRDAAGEKEGLVLRDTVPVALTRAERAGVPDANVRVPSTLPVGVRDAPVVPLAQLVAVPEREPNGEPVEDRVLGGDEVALPLRLEAGVADTGALLVPLVLTRPVPVAQEEVVEVGNALRVGVEHAVPVGDAHTLGGRDTLLEGTLLAQELPEVEGLPLGVALLEEHAEAEAVRDRETVPVGLPLPQGVALRVRLPDAQKVADTVGDWVALEVWLTLSQGVAEAHAVAQLVKVPEGQLLPLTEAVKERGETVPEGLPLPQHVALRVGLPDAQKVVVKVGDWVALEVWLPLPHDEVQTVALPERLPLSLDVAHAVALPERLPLPHDEEYAVTLHDPVDVVKSVAPVLREGVGVMDGVPVGDSEGVALGVAVEVVDGVPVDDSVGVALEVALMVAVGDGVGVTVEEGVLVGDAVSVAEAVLDTDDEPDEEPVELVVGVAVGVGVGVGVGCGVRVAVGVSVVEGGGVGERVAEVDAVPEAVGVGKCWEEVGEGDRVGEQEGATAKPGEAHAPEHGQGTHAEEKNAPEKAP